MIQPFPVHEHEAERLAALDRLQIVGRPPSTDFDAILSLALKISGCEAGTIGFLERDRHWFMAERGIGVADLPREASLCNHTLLRNEPLIVEDLTSDARFRDLPLVAENGIRFYAGVPVAGEGGFKLGTLCVTDRLPRAVPVGLTDMLRDLGHVIESLLVAHLRAVTAEVREREIWKKTRLLEHAEKLAKIGAWDFDVVSRTFCLSDEAYRLHEMEVGTRLHIDEMQALFPLSDLGGVAARYQKAIDTGEGYEILGEIRTAKGHRRWAHRIVDVEKRDGKVVRIFGAIRDLTVEHLSEQTLWRMAHFDPLTEAPNRHYWTARLNQALADVVEDKRFTILMFDLDGFKEINDTRGHAAGDAVLCEVARRLGETLTQGAFHARLGGDEFAVLLEGAFSKEEVESIVRNLLAAIQRPIMFEGRRLQVSGTFGCASFPSDAATASDLMQKADIALYQAKRSHRSSFVSFRPEIGDLFNNKRHAIDLVGAAIEQNRLVPFYQPKVDMKTGDTIGFEALCRIEAADGTILGPSQFLPALEDSASSARIGTAMLDLVTADIAAWLADGLVPGRVALNVTSADFADDQLDRRVLDRLRTLGLTTNVLEIEVTENTILGKEALLVSGVLQRMRDLGLVIALDDFGTGYASLTHLRDAPINYLKLDRSFIAGLGRGPESAIIVRSIIDLGHSLGMKVVAEGIEAKGQAEFLRAIGCDEAQGFLYGRPASSAATRAILTDSTRRRVDSTRLRDPTQTGYFQFSGAAGVEKASGRRHPRSIVWPRLK